MKDRIEYIDNLKGLAILMVVVGHFIQYNSAEGKDNVIFSIIYSFHMPLFMFISGYVAHLTVKPSIFGSFGVFIFNKGRGLLLPFFSWALLVNGYFFTRGLEFNVKVRLSELLYDPRTGLWFIWYLFFLYIFFSAFLYLSNRLNQRKNFWWDVLIVIFVGGGVLTLKIFRVTVYMDAFIQYFAYFFIGVFVCKYNKLKNVLLNVDFFSAALFSFLITVGYYSINNPDFHSIGVSLFLKVFIALTGIFCIYYLIRNTALKPWAYRFINNWGKKSLVIYATHFSFTALTNSMAMIPQLSPFLLLIISLLYAVLVIEFCLLIFGIVKKCPPLNTLLYGAKFYKN
ncbi:fucose 4-O-acetylase-like acetyltransferase [Dyadobacter jejuensis]|uniref:Fucose 4-O-acetylase-like acetyltransferase n=1 Tax=Dyadobacter jejuensis TaxID=1082580 RepID=A0A316ARQ5_9BACT|nr:acyltransferase family protein [Dyadobacter jejuensis]PWJ60383.1 fucose 4-O-acetylase-like acetyltransferase [Dyadobacter jejuensis]